MKLTRVESQTQLVVRLPNWVGDVCMALPALGLLIQNGVALHCFGRAWAPDLLGGLAAPVAALPRGLAGARALRATGASRGLLLTNSLSSAVQMRMAGIAAIGYRRDLRGILLARALVPPRQVHEAESFWRLALVALEELRKGGPSGPPPFSALTLAQQHRSDAATALSRANVAAPFTVLCPLATGTAAGQSKVWPHFTALCRRLVDGGEAVVACPGPGERAQTAAALPDAVLLDGLGLGAYAAVLGRARRVVANDSGPMHLAAAAGAPVLGVFGPSDPARTRPWSASGRAIGGAGIWPELDEVWRALEDLAAPAGVKPG